jgi:hypothetical protein
VRRLAARQLGLAVNCRREEATPPEFWAHHLRSVCSSGAPDCPRLRAMQRQRENMADTVKHMRAALVELRLRGGEARKVVALTRLLRSTASLSLSTIAADGLRAIIGAVVRALRDDCGRRVVGLASQVCIRDRGDGRHSLTNDTPNDRPRRSSNPRLSQGCRTPSPTSLCGYQVRDALPPPLFGPRVHASTSNDDGPPLTVPILSACRGINRCLAASVLCCSLGARC